MSHEPYVIDPVLKRRKVVKFGYASVSPDGKRVLKYDMDQIKRLWDEWPGLDIVEFGRHWGIPYAIVHHPRYPLSVAAKRAAESAEQRDWRRAVVLRASIPAVASEPDEIAALRQVLQQLRELGHAGTGYAHAKMVRSMGGVRHPNMAISPRDARYCMEIGARAAQIVAAYTGIREATQGADGGSANSRVYPEIVEDQPARPV